MLRAVRLITAVAIAVAVFANLALLSRRGVLNPGNYFSYFTILGNIAAVVLLAFQGLRDTTAAPIVRGAVALYMTITGIVDNVLLVGIDVSTPPWVDLIVHIIGPVVILVDWLIVPPQTRVETRTVLTWLIFPLVWLVYTLIRGARTNWYPYPFFDPAEVGGYGGVAAYGVGITIAFLVVGYGLQWAANRGR